MRTPQAPAMAGMTALGLKPRSVDEKTVAERKWRAGLRPSKPQLPADVGLFSDDADQLEMTVEMFMPVNE